MVPPPAAAEPAQRRLEVSGLSVSYGAEPVLVDVDVELLPGSICALVGMNGAGKSTLFQALMGFLQPLQGRIRIDGLQVAQAQRQQRLAYVPQGDQVDWQFPVRIWDVVMMGRYGSMNLLRWPSRSDRQRVREALQRVDLLPLANRQIGSLSGGQRKRAFLARALCQEAKLLLLDEPFTGVDRPTENLIIQVLLELRQRGATVLIATHDLEAIPRFCDQVVLLHRTVVASGPTEEVFTQSNLRLTFGTLAAADPPVRSFS